MALLEVIGATGDGRLMLDGETPSYLVAKGNRLEIGSEKTVEALAILLVTKRGWVILDLSGGRTSVNGVRVAEVKRIQHGDRLVVADASALFHEVVEATLRADAPAILRADDCFICYCKFEAGQAVVPCPVCQLAHHKDCWYFNQETCARCSHRVPKENADAAGKSLAVGKAR